MEPARGNFLYFYQSEIVNLSRARIMKILSQSIIYLCFLFLFSSCVGSRKGVLISPEKGIWEPSWSADELSKEIVIRHLGVTPETSHHIIRLKTAEKPHIHKHHDLTVFVLQGKALIHFGEQQLLAKTGDVIEIPRGIVHWAENLDKRGSQVYAVFNPPYDGKDYYPISPSFDQFESQK